MAEDKQTKNPKDEQDQAQNERDGVDQLIQDSEEKIEKLRQDTEATVKAQRAEIFKKYGYELHTDIKYDGKIIPAGTYNKLNGIPKPQIEAMLERGDISK